MFQPYDIPINSKHHVPSFSILNLMLSLLLGSMVLLEPVILLPQPPESWDYTHSPSMVNHEHLFPLNFFHCQLQFKVASSFVSLIKMLFSILMSNLHSQLEGIESPRRPGLTEEGKPTLTRDNTSKNFPLLHAHRSRGQMLHMPAVMTESIQQVTTSIQQVDLPDKQSPDGDPYLVRLWGHWL